jgi:hypothetical protein
MTTALHLQSTNPRGRVRRSILGYTDQQIPISIVPCSVLDEICLFMQFLLNPVIRSLFMSQKNHRSAAAITESQLATVPKGQLRTSAEHPHQKRRVECLNFYVAYKKIM